MFFKKSYYLLLFLSTTTTTTKQLCSAFSASSSSSGSQYNSAVYYDQSEARDSIDQACYLSNEFWSSIDKQIPNWRTDPDLERFRGFCNNLQTETPGKEVYLQNGQQLLAQYVYPGLNEEDGVFRSAYPTSGYVELQQIQQKLQNDVAPIAKKELTTLLNALPLVNDDENFNGIDDNDGDTWQRAAWYGWQFLSLRGATKYMPKTTIALKQAMGTSGPAHRFVGITRQKEHCTGTVHSDGRNYMLSTLTPLLCPNDCGIVVNDEEVKIEQDGETIILDNTYLHHIYNNGETDRFVLMSECWHPALSIKERNALTTLFALKDQFTVLDLALAPWGYDDDSLEYALTTGAVHDINFWKEIGYINNDDNNKKKPSLSSISVEALEDSKKQRNKNKKKKSNKKASTAGKGFGAK